jgi:hypothetical protein
LNSSSSHVQQRRHILYTGIAQQTRKGNSTVIVTT